MDKMSKTTQGTREKIFFSALTLFYEKGFDATSVQEITEAAGCAKDTFYLFFETKFELLIRMEEKLYKDIDSIISKELTVMTDDPYAQIDRALDAFFHYVRNADLSLVRLVHTSEILGIMKEERIAENYTNLIIMQISNFISQGIEKGFFRSLDSMVYGRIICSLLHQTLKSGTTNGSPIDFDVLKSEMSVIVRKVLGKTRRKI